MDEPRQVLTRPLSAYQLIQEPATQWLQSIVNRLSFDNPKMPIRIAFEPVCEVGNDLRVAWIYIGHMRRFMSYIDVSPHLRLNSSPDWLLDAIRSRIVDDLASHMRTAILVDGKPVE